jgi:hypothetical protein
MNVSLLSSFCYLFYLNVFFFGSRPYIRQTSLCSPCRAHCIVLPSLLTLKKVFAKGHELGEYVVVASRILHLRGISVVYYIIVVRILHFN